MYEKAKEIFLSYQKSVLIKTVTLITLTLVIVAGFYLIQDVNQNQLAEKTRLSELEKQNQEFALKKTLEEQNIKNQEDDTNQKVFELNKFVELKEPTKEDEKTGSINVREEACSPVIIGSQNWSSVGQVIEGPVEKNCFQKNWKWYKIKWSNGVKGWSISNYFNSIDLSREYNKNGLKFKYDLNWQLVENKNDTGEIMQIQLTNRGTQIIFNIDDNNLTLIGKLENNKPACFSELIPVGNLYRADYGLHKSKLRTIQYYKYIANDQFLSRKSNEFDSLYSNYLNKTRDLVKVDNENFMPFVELFTVENCANTITPKAGVMRQKISDTNTPTVYTKNRIVYIDVRMTSQNTDDNLKSVDDIIASVEGVKQD
jgi:hypothetical protein